MKHFEEFEDFYTEYRAGLQWISPENESAIKAALMLAFNSGKKSGMLASADIAGTGGDIVKGRGLEWRTVIADEIRQAAK